MKIAITGANGFAGSYLCQALEKAGNSIRPLDRGERNRAGYGDLSDSVQWDPLLAGADSVIHCAAMAHVPISDLSDAGEARRRLFRINCDAVVDLAEACVRNRVRRLVFLSSVKVYGEQSPSGQPWSEEAPLKPADLYGHSKVQAEELLKGFRARGLEILVLRLPLMYGPSPKANFERLIRLSATPLPLPLGRIQNRRSLLGLNNLAAVIDHLLALDTWPYAELNVADPEAVSTSKLVAWLAKAQGQPARLFALPDRLLWAGASLVRQGETYHKLFSTLEISTARLHTLLPELTLTPTRQSLSHFFGTHVAAQG